MTSSVPWATGGIICGVMPIRTKDDVYKPLIHPVDCVELRLDYYRGSLEALEDGVEEIISKKTTIITIRSRDEGGFFHGNEGERLRAYLTALEWNPHYVDVELDSPIVNEVVARSKSKVIISKHDFVNTPPLETLKEWGLRAARLGDVVKIVTTALSPRDSLTVLSLIGTLPKPTIAFAMGPHGAFSRVIAPLIGSPFTYAPLEESVAPGQLPLDAIKVAQAVMSLYVDVEAGVGSLRNVLDKIDDGIIYLLRRRLEICKKLGEVKKIRGFPIYDDIRENEILRKAGDFKQIFELIIQMCKAIQLVI